MTAFPTTLRFARRAASLWWLGFVFLARAVCAFATCFGFAALISLWAVWFPDSGAGLNQAFPQWWITLQTVVFVAITIWPLRFLIGKFP